MWWAEHRDDKAFLPPPLSGSGDPEHDEASSSSVNNAQDQASLPAALDEHEDSDSEPEDGVDSREHALMEDRESAFAYPLRHAGARNAEVGYGSRISSGRWVGEASSVDTTWESGSDGAQGEPSSSDGSGPLPPQQQQQAPRRNGGQPAQYGGYRWWL